MELTEGILKSVESAFHVEHNQKEKSFGLFMTFNGKYFLKNGNIKIYANKAAAKSDLLKLCNLMFRHGEYWEKYKYNLKLSTDYDVDFSETIKLFPSYGLTSRYDSLEYKKMVKELRDLLIEKEIVKVFSTKKLF